jgi:CRISPR-associated protein Csm2
MAYNDYNGGRSNFGGGKPNRPFNNGGANGYAQQHSEEDTDWIGKEFQSYWITDKIDSAFIDYAEKVGKELKTQNLSSSQIRNIYGEMKRIQLGDFEKLKTSFLLLKPKLAYNVGRNNTNGLKLFQKIFDEGYKQVSDQKTFGNFCSVIEAIIAYHRANGGK